VLFPATAVSYTGIGCENGVGAPFDLAAGSSIPNPVGIDEFSCDFEGASWPTQDDSFEAFDDDI
jgi:hypothetical protein